MDLLESAPASHSQGGFIPPASHSRGPREGVYDAERSSLAAVPEDARLRAMVDGSPIAMYAKDREERYIFTNPAFEAIYGLERGAAIGRTVHDLLPAFSADAVREIDRRVLERGETVTAEDVVPGDAGEQVFLTQYFPFRDDDGDVLAVCGISVDITARNAEVRRLAALVEHSHEAIFGLDREGVVLSWNPGAERLFGYAAREAIGERVRDLLGTDPADSDAIGERVRGGESIVGLEAQRRHRDGHTIDVSFTIAPLRDAVGTVTGAAVISRDISERRRVEDQLRHLAEVDPVTQLYNRRRFDQELQRQLDYTERYGRPGAVILLDLDHFKLVNDSYGHAAGDDVLRAVASALRRATRRSDTVARLGGDEFAVLLPESSEEEVDVVARRLLEAIADGEATGFDVKARAGVALFGSGDPMSASDLIVAADAALLDAKEQGRGRIAHYEGQSRASLGWVRQLRTALDDRAFVLFSQPIIDLATGEVVRQELLLRLPGEDGTPIPAGAFLPTAERFGLMPALDRWVVEQAAELARDGAHVNVNLSGASMSDPAVNEHIVSALTAPGVPAENIVFEITETLAIANMSHARSFARRLHELGAGLALDDFGTGFGSFTYLKHLPADHLKIDMEFIRDLRKSDADRRVVQAIVNIAEGFDVDTVAEGVEDAETLELVRELGVDAAQGYHIGRPAPVESLQLR